MNTYTETNCSDFEIEAGKSGKTAIITKYKGQGGNVMIPENIDGRQVTAIGETAFSKSLVTSVVIPQGVTVIEKFAFCGCAGLASVTIPDSVTTIEKFAFCNCAGLASVTIPTSVTAIGKYAFCDCSSLASVTVGNCDAAFGKVFADCQNLTSVTIPDGVTSIRDAAFDGFAALTSVTIGNDVAVIGKDAFSGCAGLASVTIPASVAEIGERAFYECAGLRSLTISDGVETIGEGAFYKCSALAFVTIPASVEHIGKFAFSYCADLTSVVLCGKASAADVFWNCDNLTSITSRSPLPPPAMDGVFDCVDADKITLNVPEESVDAYRLAPGWNAFRRVNGREYTAKTQVWYCGDCRKKDITCTLNENGTMTVAGTGAMEDLDDVPWNSVKASVTSVIIKDGVTSIGSGAFQNCVHLRSVNIPDSVVSVKYKAFAGCPGLTSVRIGGGVTNINRFAFDGCPNLRSIDVSPDNIKYCSADGALLSKNKTTLVRYLAGGKSYTIPESVTSISAGAFFGCAELEAVTIPESVTEIGELAFGNCANLTAVTIPNGVTSIEDYTFANCARLTSVVIGANVDTIEEPAFDGCAAIASVTCLNPIPPETERNIFGSADMSAVRLRVPAKSINAYRAAEGWNRFTQAEALG